MDHSLILQKLEALNEAYLKLSAAQSEHELFTQSIKAIQNIFPIDECHLWIVDSKRLRLLRMELQSKGARGKKNLKTLDFGEGIIGQVAQTGQLQHRTEPLDSDYSDVAQQESYGSVLAVPLRLNDRIIGVLEANSYASDAIHDIDLKLFTSFAIHVAVALNNLTITSSLERRENELYERLQEFMVLSKVGEIIISTLDVNQLLDEVLRLAADVLPFQRCAILLVDKNKPKQLSMAASRGYREDVSDKLINFGQGITGWVAEHGEPLLISDVRQDQRYITGVEGGKCEMAVPLMVQGKLLGVIDAESQDVDAFDAQSLSLLKAFASPVAVAVRNAQLVRDLESSASQLETNLRDIERMNLELSSYSDQIKTANVDLTQRVRELLIVHEASKAITSSLDLDETLMMIVSMTQKIIPNSLSAIKLYDPINNELAVRTLLDLREGERQETIAYSLSAPLVAAQSEIGVFELARAEEPDFTEGDRQLLQTLAGQAAIAIENARLFENAQQTYFETIRSLAQALEARDSYTRGHSERVTHYALVLGRSLELDTNRLQLIEHAGLLHDIGKIGISDNILHKPGSLDPDDRRVIESHPSFGDAILGPLKFLENVQGLVLHHHERFDGSGYPDGLQGEDIPLEARIISIADAFDAMTSDRPYRKALSLEQAAQELQAGAGSQFDPELVKRFINLIESGDIYKETTNQTAHHAAPQAKALQI